MWYWVKLPDDEKADHNLQELKRAVAEGRVQPDWLACRYNESEYFPVQTLIQQDDQEEADQEKPPAKYVFLVCGKCKQRFPLELPIAEMPYPCPNCQTEYKATQISDSPLVYVLMPELTGK